MPPFSPLPAADEHVAIRAAARSAEDAGNLLGATRLLGLLPTDPDVRAWARSLREGLRCSDDDRRALWLLQPAFRSGFVSATRQTLLTVAADALRTRGVAAVAGGTETAEAAARDPLLVDAGLFDLGMLARYVDRVLRPGGSPHTTLMASWLPRAASVYEVCALEATAGASAEPAQLVVRDVVSAEEPIPVQMPDVPPAVGDLIYGRVLPLSSDHRFAFPPVPVDRLTARRIGRAVLRAAPLAERLRAVASHQRRTETGVLS